MIRALNDLINQSIDEKMNKLIKHLKQTETSLFQVFCE